jgi:glutathione S-transferase
MKLYFSPGACSLAPHIVLLESGLPFALEKVDTSTHRTKSGNYYAINPKGQVPLLELDNGEYLSEGPIIAQYIADTAKNSTLLPALGSMARYRVTEWQNYITSELHKSFSPLFNPELDAKTKQLFNGMLRKKYEWVDSRLADSKFLTGDTFTIADAYLFTVTGWAPHVGLDIANLQHLQRFLKDVAARPSVKEAKRVESEG